MLAVLHAEEPKIPRIEPNAGDLVHVPVEFSTIQAAIDAVDDGGIVLVSPGVYQESLTLGGKSITLASEFLTTGDAGKIKETVLDGTLTADDGSEEVFDALIASSQQSGAARKLWDLLSATPTMASLATGRSPSSTIDLNVPEPGTIGFTLTGVIGLAAVHLRRKRQH